MSGIANLASQSLSLVITFGRAGILARLLTPDDYGVFTMVLVISVFAAIFKDLGLSTATIREKVITHAQVSNLFWINCMVGFTSMMVVIALAPLMVWFYNDFRLQPIACALSIGFLFAGLSVQHQALLKRQMRFREIAWITVLSTILTTLLGIVIAWKGHKYWALVWMNVGMNFLMMIGFWYCTKWVPSLPKKGVGTIKFLKIGLDVAGLNAFSTLTKTIDKILAGKIAGASQLGFYSKGSQIPGLVSGQFRMALFSVSLPALSALQSEKERFSEFYYRFLSSISWLTMTASAFCFLFANEIIVLYFGARWETSTVYMRIFTLQSFLMPAITSLDQVPLALGFSRRYLAVGIIRSLSTIICVLIGVIYGGTIGIAIGVVVANLLSFCPFAMLCVKDSPVLISIYFRTIAGPLLVSLLIVGVFFLFKQYHPTTTIVSKITLMGGCISTMAVCFICCDYLGVGSKLRVISKIVEKVSVKS